MFRLATRTKVCRFALVGATGFAIDAGVLSALALLNWNLYAARALSFAAAVICTYALNRRLTFRVAPASKRIESTTAAGYGVIQMGGALVNLAIFSGLVWQNPHLGDWPVAPLAVGALGGFVFNYLLSSILFRWRTHHGEY